MRYLIVILALAAAIAAAGASADYHPSRLSTGWLEIELVHPAPAGCRYTSSRVTQASATLRLECGEKPEPSTEDVVQFDFGLFARAGIPPEVVEEPSEVAP